MATLTWNSISAQTAASSLSRSSSPETPSGSDYAVEARVKPLALEGMAGVVFRYHTNRHYYVFALTGGNKVRLALHMPLESALRVRQWKELGSADFAYDTLRYYNIRGGERRAAHPCLCRRQAAGGGHRQRNRKGPCWSVGGHPRRAFKISQPLRRTHPRQRSAKRIAARDAELEKLRAGNPRPKLWKKFETPNFGAGRNVRFGDLDGDGVPEMLFAQNIPARARRCLRTPSVA